MRGAHDKLQKKLLVHLSKLIKLIDCSQLLVAIINFSWIKKMRTKRERNFVLINEGFTTSCAYFSALIPAMKFKYFLFLNQKYFEYFLLPLFL